MLRQSFLLYGFQTTDLKEIAKKVGTALGVCFEERESMYQRGDYFYWRDSSTHQECKIKRNFWEWAESDDDLWAEPSYMEFPMIMYVVESPGSSILEEKISQTLSDFAYLLRKNILVVKEDEYADDDDE